MAIKRYQVARLRFAQALIPLIILASIVVRRVSGSTVGMGAVLMTELFALGLFLSAVTRLSGQILENRSGKLLLGSEDEVVRRSDVSGWTLLGRTARIYCDDVSYRVEVAQGKEALLEAELRSVLGEARKLRRRGSKLMRTLALGVALVGAILVVFAFAQDSMVMIVVGVPAFGLGLATFGALSQRVVER